MSSGVRKAFLKKNTSFFTTRTESERKFENIVIKDCQSSIHVLHNKHTGNFSPLGALAAETHRVTLGSPHPLCAAAPS